MTHGGLALCLVLEALDLVAGAEAHEHLALRDGDQAESVTAVPCTVASTRTPFAALVALLAL